MCILLELALFAISVWKSTQVVVSVISFLLVKSIRGVGGSISLAVHPLKDVWVVSRCFLAVRNKAAISTCVQVLIFLE